MRSFLLKNKWFFLVGTFAAWALRAYFLKYYALIDGDSLIYGEIAKTWLRSGTFGMGELGESVPTLIRLPGYPAFLALFFSVVGIEHYTAVLRAQLVIDIATCFLVAEMARRLVSERAAKIAFLLAALCPFTANYCAAPLSETLSIFTTAAALLATICALDQDAGAWRYWMLSGAALAGAILLRPDGGILFAAILAYTGWRFFRAVDSAAKRNLLSGMAVLILIALAPLVPWTIRNWRVFHVFQPLAPRYANAPGEFVPMGFNRWMKTWAVEFVSTNDVFWKVSADTPGEPVNFDDIPGRAFDSPQQREQTRQLIARYNEALILKPDLDQGFGELARERVQASPTRYYVRLPMLRLADMWLRPRTEMLNLDLPWWKFTDTRESLLSLGLGLLNVFYLLWAIWGLRASAGVRHAGLLVMFIVLRSLMLATLENPEPRYTLECFPAVLILASAGIASVGSRHSLQRAAAAQMVRPGPRGDRTSETVS